jgi:hypothetical protein
MRINQLFQKIFALFVMLVFLCQTVFVSAQITKAENKDKNETAVTEKTAEEKESAPVADESKSWATLGRLYVVIATDDQLEGVAGQTAKQNGETVADLFQQNIASGAFAIVKIPSDLITRQAILSLLANLPVKPQDAICLYLSGKGGIDRKNGAFCTIGKEKEELYRSELRNALAKKNCRLNVLISDYCDGKEIPVKPEPKPESKPESKPETATDEKKPEQSEEKDAKKSTPSKQVDRQYLDVKSTEVTSPLFFSLFFQSTGTVDVLSASLRQVSMPSDQGVGCFTETFTNLLNANKNKCLSWYRFLPYLQRGTGLTFEGIYTDGAEVESGVKQASQKPVWLTINKDNYNPETLAMIYPHGNVFDKEISGASEKEVALTDDGRKIISKLVAETVTTIRPQNDNEKGTHEDYTSLDPDNTVNGVDGNPFSVNLNAVKPTQPDKPMSDKPVSDKPRFGVRAINNNGNGVKVIAVLPDSIGANAGIKVNDVILTIDGKKIDSEKAYSDAIDNADKQMKLEILSGNGGTILPLSVQFIQQ